jgi:hypothetical protein
MKGREISVTMAIELFTLNLEFRGLSDEDPEEVGITPSDDDDEDDSDDLDGAGKDEGEEEPVGPGEEKLE